MKRSIVLLVMLGVGLGVVSPADAYVTVNDISFQAFGASYAGVLHYRNHLGNAATTTSAAGWTAFYSNDWAWAVGRRWYCIDLQHWHTYDPLDWRVFATDDATIPTAVAQFNGSFTGLQMAATLYRNHWQWAEGSSQGQSQGWRRAALQLAIWEALYDYTGQTAGQWYDITKAVEGESNNGSFYVDNDNNLGTGMVAQVYSMLSSSGDDLVAGYWDDTQNLIGDNVPEPGTVVLLGLGLLGSGFLAYRKRRNP